MIERRHDGLRHPVVYGVVALVLWTATVLIINALL